MIERDLFHNIIPWLDEEKIIIINGARQVGKTTLLHALKQHLEERGEKTVYFAADQELGNPIFQDAKLFLRFAEEQYLASGEKRVYIFLDEFQYITEAGLFLKQICDRERRRIHLIVSGSSSLEIAKNSEFLTGRKISFHLSSFSFREYLRARSKMRYDFAWKQDSDIATLEEFYTDQPRKSENVSRFRQLVSPIIWKFSVKSDRSSSAYFPELTSAKNE